MVIVCGIMAVGSVKGWFAGGSSDTEYCVSEKSGIAMIERNGISYELNVGTAVRAEDRFYTKNGAALTIANQEKNSIYLNSNAELKVSEANNMFTFEMLKGEALVDARSQEGIFGTSNGTEISFDGAVATVSVQAGSAMVYIYAGEIKLTAEGTEEIISAGNAATVLSNGATVTTEAFKASSLNDTQILQLIRCGIDESFCFTQVELDFVFLKIKWVEKLGAESLPFGRRGRLQCMVCLLSSFWRDQPSDKFYRKSDHTGGGRLRICPRSDSRSCDPMVLLYF